MLKDRLIYLSDYEVSAVVTKISNIIQNLSRKKLNKSSNKRDVALFLIHICRKRIDHPQCTQFYEVLNSCRV